MASICIRTFSHAFSSRKPTRGIPKRQLKSIYELQYDGENFISTLDHVDQFIHKCKCFNITKDNEICRLFTLTLQGRIREWYKILPAKCIHSWNHFMHVFYFLFITITAIRSCA